MEFCESGHEQVCFSTDIYCPVCTAIDAKDDKISELNDTIEEYVSEIDAKDVKIEELEDQLYELNNKESK